MHQDAPSGCTGCTQFVHDGRQQHNACASDFTLQVVKMTQRRAVLVAGWSELDSILSEVEVPPQLLIVQHAPHDWLLPR
jgi:hypothetical protein